MAYYTKKNKTWEKVETEFNAISPDSCYRDAAGLKKFYENKKKEVRKVAADEKYQIRCTGGGLPPKVKKDPSYDLILSLINDKTVYGIANPFDSDSKKIRNTEITQQKVIEYELINDGVLGDIEEEAPGISEDLDLNSEGDVFTIPKENEVKSHSVDVTYDQHVSIVVPGNTFTTSSKKIFSDDPKDDVLLKKDETSTKDNSKENNWQKYTSTTLRKPPITPLRNSNKTYPNDAAEIMSKSKSTAATLDNLSTVEKVQQRSTKRKRPATVVRALSSSNIAQKYDELIDKRLKIADMMQVEYKQKAAEHLKRLELLDLEITLKKQQLKL